MVKIKSNITVKSNIISAQKVIETGGHISWYLPVELLPQEWLEHIAGLGHHITKFQAKQAEKKLFEPKNLISVGKDIISE